MMTLQRMDDETKKCRGAFKRVYFTRKKTMVEPKRCMHVSSDGQREAKRVLRKTKRARTWSCVCNSWNNED